MLCWSKGISLDKITLSRGFNPIAPMPVPGDQTRSAMTALLKIHTVPIDSLLIFRIRF